MHSFFYLIYYVNRGAKLLQVNTNSTTAKTGRSLPEIINLADQVLSAIESFGQEIKKD